MEEGDVMDNTSLAVEMLSKTAAMMRTNVPKQMTSFLHGEMFILHFLAHQEGDVLPSEISAAMNASTARVAMALKTLEGKGLIERRGDESDRRKVKVSLTGQGKKIICEQHEEMVGKMEKILAELGEKDARDYLRIISRMTEISKTIT
jgi:DNA-binding MarR family transcriptional regulator